MADQTSKTPTPGARAVKTQRDHALQSKPLADEIAHAKQVIQSVLGSPDLLLALAPIGYNERELNRGLALVTAVRTAFSAHRQGLAVASSTQATLDLIFAVAKEEFSAFRETVQDHFFDGDQIHLGASGTASADIEKFCTHARSAYAVALKYPYIGVLANHGFTLERIDAAIKALDELAATDSACKNAQGAAKAATDARDSAGETLTTWMMKFRKLSRTTLKGRSELLALLQE